MRSLACLLLLLAAPAVQAQAYKCVDASGKTRYSDKPIADCKNARTITTPAASPAASAAARAPGKMPPGFASAPKAAAKPAAKGKPAEPAKRVLTAAEAEHERRFDASRCKTLRQEEAWLSGPRGANVEGRSALLDQVRQGLASCR